MPLSDEALNERVAEIFGWRWMAWESVPIRGTDGYPDRCMTRTFCRPEAQALLDPATARPATGEEPLEFAYCSSAWCSRPPSYAIDWNAAMDAAEEVGLFRDHRLSRSGTEVLLWRVESDTGVVAAAETGPRAISEALVRTANLCAIGEVPATAQRGN